MSDRFIIRLATADDLASLGPILEASDEVFPPGRIPEPPDGRTEIDFRPALEAELVCVGVCEGLLVGFAQAERVQDSLFLSQVSVLPEFGRRGIGRALVARVIEIAGARQLPTVTLTTFSDIPWNAPFYASMGFRELPRQELSEQLRSHVEREEGAGLTHRIAMAVRVGARRGVGTD